MKNKIRIAIDAMGGENSPKKIIEGISISLKFNKNNFFTLYGQQTILEKEIEKNFMKLEFTKDFLLYRKI